MEAGDGEGKGSQNSRRKAFAKAATGEIKEALCSESFPRQAAMTSVKGMNGARSLTRCLRMES